MDIEQHLRAIVDAHILTKLGELENAVHKLKTHNESQDRVAARNDERIDALYRQMELSMERGQASYERIEKRLDTLELATGSIIRDR